MAAAGHGATHAPQPVQASILISGGATAPMRGGKRIAAASHCSPQVTQTTCRAARQDGPITARILHGAAAAGFNADVGQARTQSSQKLQALRPKSTRG